MDRHRLDADPDPNFHADPDWHQHDADPHANPTQIFTHVGKPDFFLLLVNSLIVHNVLSFLSVSNVSKILSLVFKFFICLEMTPIQIRQNDADLTRSASVSTTLVLSSVADPGSRIRCLFDPWIRDPE